jgi:hypothetical protein
MVLMKTVKLINFCVPVCIIYLEMTMWQFMKEHILQKNHTLSGYSLDYS